MVDVFAAIESARLNWVLLNQSMLRTPIYKGLVDAISVDDAITGASVGLQIYLPPSHTGLLWYMRKRYLDAMALTQLYRPPDFFITFTCNPAWEEI